MDKSRLFTEVLFKFPPRLGRLGCGEQEEQIDRYQTLEAIERNSGEGE